MRLRLSADLRRIQKICSYYIWKEPAFQGIRKKFPGLSHKGHPGKYALGKETHGFIFPVISKSVSPSSARLLWQHRAIWQEVSDRIFAPIQSLKDEGILYVFETVKKGLCPFLTKGLQSAARSSCPLTADKTHTCSLSCIFCQVQEVNCPKGARETTLGCAPTENDQNPFAACGRQTLRGFFGMSERLRCLCCFLCFRCGKWGGNIFYRHFCDARR